MHDRNRGAATAPPPAPDSRMRAYRKTSRTLLGISMECISIRAGRCIFVPALVVMRFAAAAPCGPPHARIGGHRRNDT